MIISPEITSLRVNQLGANFIHLKWDDVGTNFFYIIEYSIVGVSGELSWSQIGVVSEPEWFGSTLIPSTKYKFRVATTYPELEQSPWVVSDIIETFEINAYTITTMSNFIPSHEFVDKKLYNNQPYIDFNSDRIQASLMNENFIYDPGITNITNVENFIASDEEYHEILGKVSQVCRDVNRVYLGANKRIVYAFERFQNYCKVTGDGGQNWYYYQATNERVGYPVGHTIMYQNDNASFLLGYDSVLYGRTVDEVRFSSDQHFWSDDQLTFVKMDTDSSIPFNTLVFGTFVNYPTDIRRKVEAQAVSERWVYAVAENNLRRIQIRNTPVDVNGNLLWDPITFKITNNDKIVVKKLDVLNGVCYALVTGEVGDMLDDRRDPSKVLPSEYAGVYRFDEEYIPEVFRLGNFTLSNPVDGVDYIKGIDVGREMVTFLPDGTHVGQVTPMWESRVFKGKTHGSLMTVSFVNLDNKDSFEFESDIYSDPTNKILDPVKYANFKEDFEYPAEFDLYMEDGEIVSPSVPNGGTWVRCFGDDAYDRQNIEHIYSNMSVDGTELFVSAANYRYKETTPDTELPIENTDVLEAVKYSSYYSYVSDKKVHMYQWSTSDGIGFMLNPAKYYNEAAFDYMASTGERVWKNHSNNIVLVTPRSVYQYTIDPERNINKEVWDTGRVDFYLDNIKFDKFSKYCNGILIHKNYTREESSGGEIVGYYEFPYRVSGDVSVIWRPENIVLSAMLREQERVVEPEPEISTGLIDPNISPLITKMGPEYYLNDSNFTKFSKYYLQYLSDGSESMYGKLLNFIKLQYPREEDSFSYLWSEMRKRNIYLDPEKRDEVVKFFESKATNFYSSKGTIDSYKFLFKLLYNAEVDIDIESEVGIDYDIIVKSSNIDMDLVGRTVYTTTGRANVTYIEKQFVDGQLRWKVTIHNLIGKYIEGQILKSETSNFEGIITRGVTGKELAYSDIDYINRNRSYYVMRIKSELNTVRYKDDVIRFVHPVGFGFIGITLLTVFINAGISMKHIETIVDINKTYRFDSGLPLNTPKYLTKIDPDSPINDPEPEFDPLTGELIQIEQVQSPFIVADWNTAINESTGQVFEDRDYDTDESDWIVDGVTYTPSDRRLDGSPLFSDFSSRMSDFRKLVDRRLKDDINLPRDVSNLATPEQPSQFNIGK